MSEAAITTDIPARLDRPPWSRLHLMAVLALGIIWVLNGLEVAIGGSLGPHRSVAACPRFPIG